MGEQFELYPSSLSRAQFARLSQYADRAKGLIPQDLLQDARHRLERAEAAHSKNRLVNVRLATAIYDTIATVGGERSLSGVIAEGGRDRSAVDHRRERIFFTTLKSNRLVSLSKEQGYIHLEEVEWTLERLACVGVDKSESQGTGPEDV